jgi:hypothetical protein
MMMTVFELLNLRYEWEELVRDYKFVGKQGTLDNLEQFKNAGYKSNRFRPGFERALEITETILKSMKNETSYLSGVPGEEI